MPPAKALRLGWIPCRSNLRLGAHRTQLYSFGTHCCSFVVHPCHIHDHQFLEHQCSSFSSISFGRKFWTQPGHGTQEVHLPFQGLCKFPYTTCLGRPRKDCRPRGRPPWHHPDGRFSASVAVSWVASGGSVRGSASATGLLQQVDRQRAGTEDNRSTWRCREPHGAMGPAPVGQLKCYWC